MGSGSKDVFEEITCSGQSKLFDHNAHLQVVILDNDRSLS